MSVQKTQPQPATCPRFLTIWSHFTLSWTHQAPSKLTPENHLRESSNATPLGLCTFGFWGRLVRRDGAMLQRLQGRCLWCGPVAEIRCEAWGRDPNEKLPTAVLGHLWDFKGASVHEPLEAVLGSPCACTPTTIALSGMERSCAFPRGCSGPQLVFPSALRLSEPLHPHLHSVCIWLRLESLRGLGTWLDLFNMPALMNPNKLDRGGMPSAPSFLTPVAFLMKSCSRHIELHILLACSSLSFYVHMFPAFHLSIAALVWLHVPEARSSGCTLPGSSYPFMVLHSRSPGCIWTRESSGGSRKPSWGMLSGSCSGFVELRHARLAELKWQPQPPIAKTQS